MFNKALEETFDSRYLPNYEQGQIVFVNFGIGVGEEFSLPHYAVVVNAHDRKRNNLITVIPLTSKKTNDNVLYGLILSEKLSVRIDSIRHIYNNTADNQKRCTIALVHQIKTIQYVRGDKYL